MDRVADSLIAKKMTSVEQRCKHCGFLCRKSLIPGSDVPVVKLGNYGSNGTPVPESFVDEMYESNTISFVAASGDTPAYLSDSAYLFRDKLLTDEMTIRIASTSTTNDGDYTIAARGVSRGEILLSSADSLTTEDASTAGTVTISQVRWKPNRTTGCPSCGSLNWK
jgi:hypothetical protein